MKPSRNSLDYLHLWRGELADNYKALPRLYRALTENEVFFEDVDNKLVITFYVLNDLQKHWIEVNQFDDIVEHILSLSGAEWIEFRILSKEDLPE